MAGFIDFLIDNYLIFLLISLVLIFALIGYLVESKKEEKGLIKPREEEEDEQQKVMDIIHGKTVAGGVIKNISLNEAVSEYPKVNNEVTSTDTVMDTTPVIDSTPIAPVDTTPVAPIATDGLGSVPTMNATPVEAVEIPTTPVVADIGTIPTVSNQNNDEALDSLTSKE